MQTQYRGIIMPKEAKSSSKVVDLHTRPLHPSTEEIFDYLRYSKEVRDGFRKEIRKRVAQEKAKARPTAL